MSIASERPTDGRQQYFESRQLSEAQQYIASTTAAFAYSTDRTDTELRFEHSCARLGQIAVDHVRFEYPGRSHLLKNTVPEYFMFQLIVAGNCVISEHGKEYRAGPGNMVVVNPRREYRKTWIGVYDQMMFRIDKRHVARALQLELGRDTAEIEFATLTTDASLGRLLTKVLESSRLDFVAAGLGHWRVERKLEDLLLTLLLSGLPHTESEAFSSLPMTIAPYYVKRTEEFIRGNAATDIAMADLVAAAGVSARALFYGFKRFRGMPPMAYLRAVRLDSAQRALKQTRTGRMTTVTEVAFQCGYLNLSRFARDYRMRFGESPSTTLRGY